MGVGAQGDAEGAGEAEVGEFQVARAIDEEVLRFQVAVEDPVGMAVADAEEELVGEFLDLQARVLESVGWSLGGCGGCTIASPSPI